MFLDSGLRAAFAGERKLRKVDTICWNTLDSPLNRRRWCLSGYNTFATPVNCRPFEWGADIVTHSTTTDDAEVDGYKLMWFAVHTSNMTTSTSVVRLELDGQQFEAVCSGDGPVDAAFEAIDQIIRPVEHSFDLYRINSISPGKDTMGDVSVKLSCDNRTFSGRGLHTNIVEASVRAYISAMNKLRAYAARRAKGEV